MIKEGDVHLVSACLGGDKNAYSDIIERYQKIIFNAALRMTGDYDDASDIAQKTFIKAFENLERYDPKQKFFSWIYRIMVNESINQIKQNNLRNKLEIPVNQQVKNPEEIAISRELSEKVEDAVGMLGIDHKVIIILKHFIDLSYNEIGYILDIPDKKVKSRLYSARRKLCDILQQQGVNP